MLHVDFPALMAALKRGRPLRHCSLSRLVTAGPGAWWPLAACRWVLPGGCFSAATAWWLPAAADYLFAAPGWLLAIC